MVKTGRHFLQIPGPTNVPDRVLRAIDQPTIDHRGPEFAELGKAVVAGMKSNFPFCMMVYFVKWRGWHSAGLPPQ